MTDSAAEQPDVRDVPGTSRTDSTSPITYPEPDSEPVSEPVDLDAIERDLAGVERALERLSEGTYWTDEVTGEPLPERLLADDPTARRA